ncbi:unnamed protein product [Clavelina lepadiformis]|uniref:Aldehyde dehydrogenase domain-containing protein n=1 Tax=Clavelina lepadiformis TaxID=159417 RepID=A0ABP0GM41_CLALP
MDNVKAEVHVVQNFINGTFVAPTSKEYMESVNPSTGGVLAKIPSSTKDDVDQAVKFARKAFTEWSETSPQFRSKVMLQIADMIEANAEELAQLESADQGKPVSLARRVDIPRAIYNFRFFATCILHEVDNVTQLQGPSRAMNYVERMPVGVAGLISPWNLPLYLLTWKICPAIAFGNTCVAKPSEMTSLTAWKLAQFLKQSELPPGVVNLVFGFGTSAGEAIVAHPDIPIISFTGSTAIGQHISAVSAPFCKKLSLELGGKNAAIIFDDADIENCLATTVRSSFANQGEVCLCTSRIFVQRKIYSSFVERFVRMVREIKVGDPKDPKTTMGALISQQHKDKVMSYIQLAREDDGKIECGEGVDKLNLPAHCQNGFFVLPTVVTGLTTESRCLQDEIFGPVTCVVPFDNEAEGIAFANDARYGLCATLWTQDVTRAHRVSRKLKVGTVWINCWLVRDLHMPFGGMKMSGVGRESAEDSRDFFTEKKTVCLKY